jgi:hypothetical protein
MILNLSSAEWRLALGEREAFQCWLQLRQLRGTSGSLTEHDDNITQNDQLQGE